MLCALLQQWINGIYKPTSYKPVLTSIYPAGGEDFEDVNITVNFRAGENVSLVSLCAKDDDIVELPENFILYIQVGHEAFHHGVTHLQNGTVRIFLEDNDSECSSNTQFFTQHPPDPTNLYRFECEHMPVILVYTVPK